MNAQRLPPWTADYIGIPFKARGRDRGGIDCLGLVRLILMEQANIVMPSYADQYESFEDRELLTRLIAGGRSGWVEVGRGYRAAPQARLFDVVTFRDGKYEDHFGLVIGMDRMLHVLADADSRDCSYMMSAKKFSIGGFYRHESLSDPRA